MGLGICLICRKEDFIYQFFPNGFKYLWFCHHCSIKLFPIHYNLLKKLDLSFKWEYYLPEKKNKFRKQRNIISNHLDTLINKNKDYIR